jgi:prepilin-type N-terminal cleavage/methylation domain-containing protein
MAQLVREGREIDQAIAVARFPLYIVNPVIAGQRSASLVETTQELNEKLIIDLDVFGAKVVINVFLTIAVAGFVLSFRDGHDHPDAVLHFFGRLFLSSEVLNAIQKNQNIRRRQSGFTLLEIMTVLTIIGVLAALVVPNIKLGKSKGAELYTLLTTTGKSLAQFKQDALPIRRNWRRWR